MSTKQITNMKVFEDLIEELKDENLLEGTVFDDPQFSLRAADPGIAPPVSDFAITPNASGPAASEIRGDLPQIETSADENDFYRKRAIEEVSSLQMVEHVLSGVEREHLKAVPSTYDDLEAKKALHRFLQVAADANSAQYAEAEHLLMQETGAWNTALTERDSRISVANIRRFCENSRPVLSSQALIALARFYRNAPYSEPTRAKFDFVMTRLFARDSGEEKRKLLFGKADMVGHIETLYANWSSISYTADIGDAEQKLIVASFQARIREADQAKTFDQLVSDDFFKKIHEFKESLNETFFVPAVTAAAIECNVRIGNKFVDLIHLERSNTSPATIEDKYGYTFDQVVSQAAGRTLHLVELLRGDEYDDETSGKTERSVEEIKVTAAPVSVNFERAPVEEGSRFFRVNKWLLAVTILAVLSSVGIYFVSEQYVATKSAALQAKEVDLGTTEFKEYLEKGRLSSTTFYAVTLPTWTSLPDDKQKEVLQKALEFGQKNGVERVQLVNYQGRNVAYASNSRVEIQGTP